MDRTSFKINADKKSEWSKDVCGPSLLSLVCHMASNYSYTQGLFSAAEHQEFAQGRQERDDNDAQDDRNEIMVYIGNGTAQEIADTTQSRRPEQSADNIVEYECPVMHMTDTRENRGKGADDREKPRKDDGFGAVGFIEHLCAFQVVFVEEERIFFFKNRRTHFFAERIADDNAWNGSGECHCYQYGQA